MSLELLLELGTEEIPAGYLTKAMVALKTKCEVELGKLRLGFDSVQTLGTPRRLTLSIVGLAAGQDDLAEEMVGPPARVAFDEEDKPTKAALGFAKRNGVAIEDLRKGPAEGKKGEYLLCTRKETGKKASDVLPDVLSGLLKTLPWPKSMRWHEGEEAFVRPVHWLVCMLGGEVLPLSFASIAAGNESRGHRFLAPASIELSGTLENYTQVLREAFVVVDTGTRQTMIAAEICRIESEVEGTVRPDEELVAEVANLIEYPVGICGEFPEEYLEVPGRVIVSAMRSHQRYFAMNRPDGTLLNRFVTIAGTVTRDAELVRRGNERVLAARLADAQFFFREDLKRDLEFFAGKLDDVVFQKKLGSISDKVARFTAGAIALAGDVGVDVDSVSRACKLCKADLCSQMVSEFPELQGTMGRRYATLAGEPEAVSVAIEEHYLPRGASDDLPTSDVGALIGIADRLDTIAGCFSIGVVPTGSADPFGLRRAALGILRLLVERTWPVDLVILVERAVAAVATGQSLSIDAKKVCAEVLDFLRIRFRGLLADSVSLPGDCVDAALAVGFHNPRDARARAEAVSQLRSRDDFEPLAAAFKRVANILKGQSPSGTPNPEAFVEDGERGLWTAYQGVLERVDTNLESHNYVKALQILSELKGPVDSFFDAVLVMDKDEGVRDNRLAMLGRINDTFTRIADFRQLAV
ncbi:MAG: glycine--tRNA ligase subunit beta [Myxococcales bacterium]|nr:glycine--tRNA ligase subunit beta [Myxococcales bacterium]